MRIGTGEKGGGRTATDGGSEDESTETKERKERHADGAIVDVARQGEKEGKEENRGREKEKGGGGRKRGRMAVRRTWWTVHGCQEGPMASHMHLTSPSGREQAAL